MLSILFDSNLKSGSILVNEINTYASHVHEMQFEKAAKNLEVCFQRVNEERKVANCEKKRNQIFILSLYIGMLQEYMVFWERILKGEYSESWITLQNILDLLRILKKFNEDHTKFRLKFLEKQLTGFEKLYPYRIFASTEMIVKDVECSICGKDFHSLECEHLSGELYNGQMAQGIINKIESVSAVALVENPKDKRCVMLLENSDTDFRLVSFLQKSISELKISPWDIEGVRQTSRKKEIYEFDIKGNEACPCGSGRKFEDCCEHVGYVEMPHMDIIVTKNVSDETDKH